MLLSYKPLHLEARQRLQEGCVVDITNYLGVPIHGNDMELPHAYLDYSAMVRHRFLERNEQFQQYRLIFDRQHTVHIALITLV